MKRIVFLILLVSSSTSSAQWVTQLSAKTNLFNSVFFIDAKNGWTVGYDKALYNCLIMHTTNGGNSWDSQMSGTPSGSLSSVFFLDTNIGWAVGSTILYTTNGGKTWINQIDYELVLQSVFFVDTNSGWAIGATGYGDSWILHTTNSGKTWVNQPCGYYFGLNSMSFIDKNTGWVVGSALIHTTDAGSSWNPIQVLDTGYILSIFFIDSKTGWASGTRGTIVKTTDGGNTWTIQISKNIYSDLKNIYFTDINHGTGVGDQGLIFHTTDGGITWVKDSSTSSYTFTSVSFSDAYNGWIAGNNQDSGGIVIHTTNGGGTSRVQNQRSSQSNGITLNQNYPNPLNSSTTFNYNIPKTLFVTLRIMNALGEEVSRLVSEVESEGTHEAKWDAHDMPNGIYFCELRVGEYSQSVRVIVVK